MQEIQSSNWTPEDENLTRAVWDNHYTRDHSKQSYPDENLVRLLSRIERGPALDLGCGSGRHTRLLQEMGFDPVFGTDTSGNALELTAGVAPGASLFLLPDTIDKPLPIEKESLALVVIWGVLHYNTDSTIDYLLDEARRILRKGGVLVGTLRSSRDNHFQGNPDMTGASIRLFDRHETMGILEPRFAQVRLGHLERIPVGEDDRRIAHWIFEATRES